MNISARWAGATGQLHVSWQTPLPDYPNFFLYEVRYSAVSPVETPHGTAWDPSKQHTGDPPTHLSSSTHPPTAGGAAVSPRAGQVGAGAGGLRDTAAPQSPTPLLQDLVLADTWVVLQHLQPGVRYHIQVRTKPDGTSMDGVWGPWSQAVAAETPHSSGEQPGAAKHPHPGVGPGVGEVQQLGFEGPGQGKQPPPCPGSRLPRGHRAVLQHP